LERRLAAILAADVVGYSRLIGADEEGTLTALKSLRTDVIEPLINEHQGRIVKLMGDGFLVEFQSAVYAVKCAIAWQTHLAKPDCEPALTFRIGVNLGDIAIDGDDILGDGVNVAARLEASGAPGHVLISDDVHRQIDGKIQTVFHNNGSIELKNIAQPVPVWSWPEPLAHSIHTTRAGRKPLVHVAQFEAQGAHAGALVQGLQNDLITGFTRQSGVSLVTDLSVADFVVVGNMRGAQGRWRISASLVDQGEGKVVWSERFDEAGGDIFDIQDRCVTRIIGAVRIRLPSILVSRLAKKALREMNTQDLLNYAMNRHFTPVRASWDEAVPALQLVLERDGDNWMAITMLSFNIFTKMRICDWRQMSEADAETARCLIERAHVLKPSSEVVRLVHGGYLFYVEHDHGSARIEVEESLRLNPNYYHSIDLMSQIEAFSGDAGKAKQLALRATDCDPGYPYLHLYQRSLGYVHLVVGDHAAAEDLFRRADRAAPGLPQNLIGIAASIQLQADANGAQAAMGALLQLVPDFNLDEYEPWPFLDPSKWVAIREALEEAGSL
jgi:adenylate cyclase